MRANLECHNCVYILLSQHTYRPMRACVVANPNLDNTISPDRCTMDRKHSQIEGRMICKSTQMPELYTVGILLKKSRSGKRNNILSIEVCWILDLKLKFSFLSGLFNHVQVLPENKLLRLATSFSMQEHLNVINQH